MVEAVPDDHPGAVHRSVLHCDGAGAKHLQIPAGGGKLPMTHATLDERLHFVKQEGRIVFKYAVANIAKVVREVLGIPDEEMLVCGMSIGVLDETDVTSQLVTVREPVSDFATFHES